MSKRAEEAALKAYPVHPMTISPQEGKHGEILNFDEWLDDFRIGIQSLSANAGFRQGYEQAEKDLGWHSVDEFLPPVDEEVIVLRNESNGITLPYPYNLSYGHLVADKTIFVEYNGWNIPGVMYWMPMPKLEEEK